MRRNSIPALLCALLLLAGCTGPPVATPTSESTAPSPTAEPTPTATAAETDDEYERYHIDEVGATILLPKSWTNHYVVETTEGVSGFTFAQKDYLAGEWGVREDGTEGPIPDPDGHHVALVCFDSMEKAEFEREYGDPSGLSDTGPSNYLFSWLGERDGTYYMLWYPTSFSSGDSENAEEKYELFNTMTSDIESYPADASDYFIFDDGT